VSGTAEAPAAPITVRRITAMDELAAASDVVLEVTGYRDIHPGVLLSVVHTGGYVSAAYDGERCIGALYGLLGLREGKPFMHSEMVAVLPEYQGHGIAQKLKLDQRDFALERGLDPVTWTFDPLRGRNANMNIRRLGCDVVGYVPDMFGDLPGFSSGWPTDQLLLEWRVASPRAEAAIAREDVDARFGLDRLVEVTQVEHRGDGLEDLVGWTPDLRDEQLLVRVPQDAQAMRAADMELVLRWRHGIRAAMQHYLAAGFHIEWFVPQVAPVRRNVYVLSRERVI
jgi:chorismate synthase